MCVRTRVRAWYRRSVTSRAKLLVKILAGTSDQNIAFSDLVALLRYLGFELRTAGSHHILSRDGVAEILNLQARRDGTAKPYQVKQVWQVITRYGIAGEDDATSSALRSDHLLECGRRGIHRRGPRTPWLRCGRSYVRSGIGECPYCDRRVDRDRATTRKTNPGTAWSSSLCVDRAAQLPECNCHAAALWRGADAPISSLRDGSHVRCRSLLANAPPGRGSGALQPRVPACTPWHID